MMHDTGFLSAFRYSPLPAPDVTSGDRLAEGGRGTKAQRGYRRRNG